LISIYFADNSGIIGMSMHNSKIYEELAAKKKTLDKLKKKVNLALSIYLLLKDGISVLISSPQNHM